MANNKWQFDGSFRTAVQLIENDEPKRHMHCASCSPPHKKRTEWDWLSAIARGSIKCFIYESEHRLRLPQLNNESQSEPEMVIEKTFICILEYQRVIYLDISCLRGALASLVLIDIQCIYKTKVYAVVCCAFTLSGKEHSNQIVFFFK